MRDYIIRKAKIKDKEAMSVIYVNSWEFAYAGIAPQDYLDSLSVEKYMERLEDRIQRDIRIL